MKLCSGRRSETEQPASWHSSLAASPAASAATTTAASLSVSHTSSLLSASRSLLFLLAFPPPVLQHPNSRALSPPLPLSLRLSLSFSSTPKAFLYFLVTLIDCINLSAYWISSALCREPCTICL